MNKPNRSGHKVHAHILTLKLMGNYGGVLQAYSLRNVINQYASSVSTGSYTKKFTTLYTKLGLIRRIVLRHILGNKNINDISYADEKLICNHIERFIDRYLVITNNNLTIDADIYVVGSDQVWRAAYAPIDKFLFSKIKPRGQILISYAASFGKDDLSEYSSRLITKTARLAKKFNAISVREQTGVNIAQKHWGVKAEQHVDPTLLLDKEHYEVLIAEDKQNVTKSKGDLFAYVLDRDDKKERLIDDAAKALDLTPFEIMPPKPTSRKELKNNLDKFQLPPVTQWLKSFQDAEFVITDSFHGCVFSIIFNKPFIAIGNRQRGMARFTSLLKLFGLEDRLVADASDVTEELLKSKIDWKKVNDIKKKELRRSMEYLNKHLNQS